jgi:hypothetical protein
MTDEQQSKFIEDFANDSSVAIGGGIKVSVSTGHTHYEPDECCGGLKIEDANFLHDQISGATSFVYWLRRSGYDIIKRKRGK